VTPDRTGNGPRHAVERARLRTRHWKYRPPVGNASVIPLPPRPDDGIHRSRLDDRIQSTRAFDQLTAKIVMQQHAAGTLDAGIVAALLLAVHLTP
jgi:hypothetical protein